MGDAAVVEHVQLVGEDHEVVAAAEAWLDPPVGVVDDLRQEDEAVEDLEPGLGVAGEHDPQIQEADGVEPQIALEPHNPPGGLLKPLREPDGRHTRHHASEYEPPLLIADVLDAGVEFQQGHKQDEVQTDEDSHERDLEWGDVLAEVHPQEQDQTGNQEEPGGQAVDHGGVLRQG